MRARRPVAATITKYTNPATTDAALYKAEVNTHRSWVQLCAHSWPGGHALSVPDAATEYVEASYSRDVNPPNAHFYNRFCCGPGLYARRRAARRDPAERGRSPV